MSDKPLHRLQEGALSAAKTPPPPAPSKLVPVSNGFRPTSQPATPKEEE